MRWCLARKKQGRTPLSGLFLALAAFGCSGSPLEPIEVASVEIAPAELTVRGGTLDRFETVARDTSGKAIPGVGFDWSTSDPSVAVVDADGYVWSFKVGTVTATVSAPGKGKSAGNGRAVGHARKDATVEVTDVASNRPSRVTDLQVVATTSTTATLSFTEVDDGTGSPADYLVRFQIAPVSWSSAADVVWGTCAVPLKGGVVGSERTCTVERLADGTTYGFQLVAYRGTLGPNAVYGDLSNVDYGSTPPSGPTLTGAGGAHPNEPPGFEILDERGFASIGEGGWTDRTTENPNLIVGHSDPSAPYSPSSVARVLVPKGMQGGYSSVGKVTTRQFAPTRQLYISFWVRFDPNWQGHDSGVNKILYITDSSYGGGGDPVYVAAYGSDADKLQLQVRLQGPGDERSVSFGSANLRPNVGAGEIIRGQWHHVELLLRMNTGRNADGMAIGWVDASEAIRYADVRFSDDDVSAHRFDGLHWEPVWGGMGDEVTANMYMWMDHIYISSTDK